MRSLKGLKTRKTVEHLDAGAGIRGPLNVFVNLIDRGIDLAPSILTRPAWGGDELSIRLGMIMNATF